jgi:hypothetical protein
MYPTSESTTKTKDEVKAIVERFLVPHNEEVNHRRTEDFYSILPEQQRVIREVLIACIDDPSNDRKMRFWAAECFVEHFTTPEMMKSLVWGVCFCLLLGKKDEVEEHLFSGISRSCSKLPLRESGRITSCSCLKDSNLKQSRRRSIYLRREYYSNP